VYEMLVLAPAFKSVTDNHYRMHQEDYRRLIPHPMFRDDGA